MEVVKFRQQPKFCLPLDYAGEKVSALTLRKARLMGPASRQLEAQDHLTGRQLHEH
jgi:hypothetical protein